MYGVNSLTNVVKQQQLNSTNVSENLIQADYKEYRCLPPVPQILIQVDLVLPRQSCLLASSGTLDASKTLEAVTTDRKLLWLCGVVLFNISRYIQLDLLFVHLFEKILSIIMIIILTFSGICLFIDSKVQLLNSCVFFFFPYDNKSYITTGLSVLRITTCFLVILSFSKFVRIHTVWFMADF